MKQYLDILKNIYENGTEKAAVRFDENGNPIPVENGTRGTFCEIFRHDMKNGFPLLTTRKIPIKSLSIELEGFIAGITDKSWYQERGCKYWDYWCNPQLSKNDKKIQKEQKDLGPIYGYQWRSFNKTYKTQSEDDGDYNSYTDQLKNIVNKLHDNPYDRRMICSAWNPNQIHHMALPPCHYSFTVVVYGNILNLCWKQRSVDTPLGLPSNIASYAILLKLLAKEAGLIEGELVGILEDCHFYNNQINGVKEQLTRTPVVLPKLTIPDENWNGIFKWAHKDILLTDYNPNNSKIDFGSITV